MSERDTIRTLVLPVLAALGWDVHNVGRVREEYAVGHNRRVDIALFPETLEKRNGPSPLVLVEVKQLGRLASPEGGGQHEVQVARYAFEEGVPLAVLTDGDRWRLFHPFQPSRAFAERCILDLRLRDTSPGEPMARAARELGRYLRASQSPQELRERLDEGLLLQSLPALWRELLEGPDAKRLLRLLDQQAQQKLGFKLQGRRRELALHWLQRLCPPNDERPREADPAPPPSPPLAKGYRLHFLGRPMEPDRSARACYMRAIELLAERDPQFLPRFAQERRVKRRYVARRLEDLGLKREEWARPLSNGWWLNIYFGRRGFENALRLACRIAGLRYGPDGDVWMESLGQR